MARIADHLETPYRECTSEERWDVEPKVAVMLTGNKTAKRVLPTLNEANKYIQTELKTKDKDRAYTEPRNPSDHEKNKRCQFYCRSKSVCPFAKSQNYI